MHTTSIGTKRSENAISNVDAPDKEEKGKRARTKGKGMYLFGQSQSSIKTMI